jgi:hypothetical protein
VLPYVPAWLGIQFTKSLLDSRIIWTLPVASLGMTTLFIGVIDTLLVEGVNTVNVVEKAVLTGEIYMFVTPVIVIGKYEGRLGLQRIELAIPLYVA